jgi:hypothetical protein
MPSGHVGTLMPQRLHYINDAAATLEGIALGAPTRLATTPDIGGVALPARGILSIGQGAWHILDPVEYRRTRAEAHDVAPAASERAPT